MSIWANHKTEFNVDKEQYEASLNRKKMKTIREKMNLNITLAKITMLKEDIRFTQEMVDEKRERLKELEWKFRKLQNQES